MPKSLSARTFVALIVVSGFLVVAEAVLNAHSRPTTRFVVLLILAVLAARLKVKLPGLTGIMSVNLPFILLSAALMGRADAAILAFMSTFAQCLPRGNEKFNPVQLVFNCCAMTLTVTAARFIYVSPEVIAMLGSPALRLALAAAGYFLVNTVTVTLVISLSEKANLVRTWAEMFQLSFPYVVASAGVAGLALTIGREIGWQVPLAILPVMIGVFYSYRRYFAAAAAAVVSSSHLEGTGMAARAHV